jgi:surfeit locus 1 family protein
MSRSPRLLFPALLTLVMLGVLLSLGTWQVKRLHWKLERIETISLRQNAAPIGLKNGADIAALQEPSHHYQAALLRGRFGPQQVFWYTQISRAPAGLPPQARRGYHVLSPFYLSDGSVMMVDRGFVPEALKETLAAPDGVTQEIAVVLRWPDQRGTFDAGDQPADNLFYVRDPQAIGAHWQISLPPVIGELAATPDGQWPYGGQTRMVLSNNHLQYAVTWYGLAVVLVFISGLWHIRAWKQRAAQD